MRLFTQAELKSMADTCTQKVLAIKDSADFHAEPFKHFVIDNFFDKELCFPVISWQIL